MEIDNELSEAVRDTEKAKYDASCKRLLGQKVILAQILKNCVEEFYDCNTEDIANKYIEGNPYIATVGVNPDETNEAMISGANSEDTSKTEGKVTFDVLFYAIAPKNGELIKIIINVEAQRNSNPGYSIIKRALYYCSRLISSQYGREFSNSHYEKIKKVYSIWICLEPKKEKQNTITRYLIKEETVYGNSKDSEKNYDLLNAYIINISKEPENVDNKIIKLLSTILSDELPADAIINTLKTEFNIPTTKAVEKEVLDMCNLSQAIEEKGIKKGREKGIAEGREKGIAEGREKGVAEGIAKGLIEAAVNLAKTQNWTIEKALAAVGVAKNDIATFVEAINKSKLL